MTPTINPVRAALMKTLSGDSELKTLATGVFHQIADSGSSRPYIIFQKMSGVPSWTMKGPPMDWDMWLVKGVGTPAEAEAIDIRCKELLNDLALTIDGKTHQYLRHDHDVDLPEEKDGERFDHVGAVYRLVSEETS